MNDPVTVAKIIHFALLMIGAGCLMFGLCFILFGVTGQSPVRDK